MAGFVDACLRDGVGGYIVYAEGQHVWSGYRWQGVEACGRMLGFRNTEEEIKEKEMERTVTDISFCARADESIKERLLCFVHLQMTGYVLPAIVLLFALRHP